MRAQAQLEASLPADSGRKSEAARNGRLRAFLLRLSQGGSAQRVSVSRQYATACIVFIGSFVVDVWLEDLIGYEAIALVYLLAVVVLALFVNRGPIIFGTDLTALGWAFSLRPAIRFTFPVFTTK